MTNEPITRKLRNKRTPRRPMIDGTYQVTAYWASLGNRTTNMITKTITVIDGVAYHDGTLLDLSLQGWLGDHHIPTA